MSTYNKAALLGGNRVIVSPNTEAHRQFATKQILKKMHLSRKTFNKAVKALSYMPKRAADTPKRKRTKHLRYIPKKYEWDSNNIVSPIYRLKRSKSTKTGKKKKKSTPRIKIVYPK